MQSSSRDGLAAKGLRLTKKRGLLFRTAAGNRAHAFLHAITAIKRLGMRGILASGDRAEKRLRMSSIRAGKP